MTLLLLSTQYGWTQQSKNWTILKTKESKDTLIQYIFYKNDIRNLRLYIRYLEKEKELNTINEEIIKKQNNQIFKYEILVNNKDSIINFKNNIIEEKSEINISLEKDVKKYKEKASKWPYWLGGGVAAGLIGGILLCLSIK